MFNEGSKQRKGIFHDTVGTCHMCGKTITEEELKLPQSKEIKGFIDKKNRVAKLKIKLNTEGLKNMTIAEMKELDPALLEDAKDKAYRQICKELGVVILGN